MKKLTFQFFVSVSCDCVKFQQTGIIVFLFFAKSLRKICKLLNSNSKIVHILEQNKFAIIFCYFSNGEHRKNHYALDHGNNMTIEDEIKAKTEIKILINIIVIYGCMPTWSTLEIIIITLHSFAYIGMVSGYKCSYRIPIAGFLPKRN